MYVPVRLSSSFLRLIVSPFSGTPLNNKVFSLVSYLATTLRKRLSSSQYPENTATAQQPVLPKKSLREKTVFLMENMPGMRVSLGIGSECKSILPVAQLRVMF